MPAQLDGVTALAALIIASFAIDRLVTGILFLLSFASFWTRRFPDPTLQTDLTLRSQAEKRNKLVYFTLAAAFGGFVLAYWGNVRLMQALGFQTGRLLDTLITALILVGGAERLSGVLKLPTERREEQASVQPVQITGTLIMQEERSALKAKAS